MLYTEHAAAYTSDTVTICQDCLNAYTTQEINELTGTPLGTLLRVSCREPLGGCDCCVRKKHPAPAQAPCKPLDPRKIAARRERSRRAHGGNPTYVRIDSWGRPVDSCGVVLDIDITGWGKFHPHADKDGDPVGWHVACPPGIAPPDYPVY